MIEVFLLTRYMHVECNKQTQEAGVFAGRGQGFPNQINQFSSHLTLVPPFSTRACSPHLRFVSEIWGKKKITSLLIIFRLKNCVRKVHFILLKTPKMGGF